MRLDELLPETEDEFPPADERHRFGGLFPLFDVRRQFLGDVFRDAEDVGGQVDDFGEGEAVVFFLHGAAGDSVEHFHLVGFGHVDREVEVDDAAAFGEDGRQVAEVGGEPDEGAAVDEGFGDGDGDGEAVAGAGASAEFVDYDHASVVDVAEDEGRFAHFGGEGGDVGFDAVVYGDAGEELVEDREGCIGCRDEASYLSHDSHQCD